MRVFRYCCSNHSFLQGPDLPTLGEKGKLNKLEYPETLGIPEANSSYYMEGGIWTVPLGGTVHLNATGPNGSVNR